MEERKALAALIAHSGTSLEEHRRSDSGWVQLPGTRRGGAKAGVAHGGTSVRGCGAEGAQTGNKGYQALQKASLPCFPPCQLGGKRGTLGG